MPSKTCSNALFSALILAGLLLTSNAFAADNDLCGSLLSSALRNASHSRDVQASRRATQAASACNRVPETWVAAQRWRKLDPEGIDALQSYWVSAIETYRIDEARAAFAELLKRDDVEADRMMSELLPMMQLGSHGAATWRAIAPLIQAERLAPETLLLLANLAVDSGDFAAGQRLASALLARDPGQFQARLLLAQVAAAQGHDTEAVNTVQAVLASSPKADRFALVDMLLNLERNEDAEQALQAMRERAPEDLEINRRLALLALQQNDLDTARARFMAQLSSNPGETLYFLALIAERRGENDQALDAYMRLVRAGAGLRPRARAAAILLGRGKDDEGRKLIADYASAGGQEAIDAANAWSAVLVEAGRADAAVDSLRAALKDFPGHPSLEYQLGLTLAQGGHNREAVAQLEKYLRGRPLDPNAMNALGYTLADSGAQLPRAEQLIRDALKSLPDSAALIDSLGWVRYRRGDTDTALKELERAWQLSRDPEIAAHWGEVLWAADRKGEARSVWARGLARDPDSHSLKAVIDRLAGAKGP